ncbi:MAG: GHKL domain-containing protein [Acetatifactor sp.]|nr:GHKL domain-containing protein [Acetatifactor sp.]
MFTLKDYLTSFTGSLIPHAVLAIYLFVIMGMRGWRVLKKLPALLLSPLLAVLLAAGLYTLLPNHGMIRFCMTTLAILLMCTLWVRWAWRTESWQAFSAVCMGGVFQMATSCLSQILFLYSDLPLAAVMTVYLIVLPVPVFLLCRLRFGHWFRLLLGEGFGQRRTALFLFAMAVAMEAFLILQVGIQPEYLVPYFMLVLAMAAFETGLVMYLAQRLDAARKMDAQRDVIAQQQLYERDLEAIRQEVRSFRHDYKNLLAGLSEQADEGELDQLRTALSELDTGFDRRIGEKIRASTQIGNVYVPQVRSLLLSKLAAIGQNGIDCRLEVLYPVERVWMDVWDFTRCMGILLDNAAEAALKTETPWVEIILLSQKDRLSLRVSNPYIGAIDPDKIWTEGFSTKGEGRGLGLPGYQRILADYPHAASSTSWAGGVFIQELTVEEKA